MYQANETRYDTMQYNRCGKSGLKLPTVSLGLWHNFGDFSSYDNMKNLCFTAFDHGITRLVGTFAQPLLQIAVDGGEIIPVVDRQQQ